MTVNAPRLKVFLTVDSEIWPSEIANELFGAEEIRHEFPMQFAHYILGRTANGEYGIRHQMRVLDRYGLKATFFQETLFSEIAGREWLADIVSMIVDGGHDIQLHVHTEWLGRREMSVVLPRRINIREYSVADQASILRRAKELLVDAGAPKPIAFRAGNFGASHETLRALEQVGIRIDSSYNYPYLGGACSLALGQPLTDPAWLGQIAEFPVSFHYDFLNRPHPAHLIACSQRELEWALTAAWQAGWPAFVIVWHSRELLYPRQRAGDATRVNHAIAERLEGLARFLAENPARFECNVFGNCDTGIVADLPRTPRPIRAKPALTVQRMLERVASQLQRAPT
ncbi:MAG TPA: polysaccharide deacetylase family protein [Bryobacteraceae bacterium]|nr:polysaccharide deacetylase family protein [Bryobacteraceae bacterium]